MNSIILLVLGVLLPTALCHDDGMFLCKKLDADFDMVIPGKTTNKNNNNNNNNNKNNNKDRVTRVNGNAKPKPGPRGPRGRPGTSNVKVLDKKIEDRLKALEERIAFLESVNEMNRKDAVPAKLESSSCPGVKYEGQCFIFVKKERGTIDAREARNRCKSAGAVLADIYDKDHLTKLEEYLRKDMTEDIAMVYFIVGMTYRREDQRVHNRNGVESSFVQWYSDRFPLSNTGLSQIQVQVNKDTTTNSGMYNTSPLSKAKSALCEKPWVEH